MKFRNFLISTLFSIFAFISCYTAKPNKTVKPQPLTAVYSNNVINILGILYYQTQLEIPLCMIGQRIENRYYVNELVFPTIISSSQRGSRFDSFNCLNNKDYLGIIHNHNKVFCGPSTIDLKRFVYDERAKLETIVCDVYYNPETGTADSIQAYTLYKDLIPKEKLEELKLKLK